MSGRLVALIVAMVLLGVLTALALMDVGYFGILRPHFQSWGGAQVFTDLVLMCTLGCVWMIADARTSGLNPWPFVLITLVAGSFGPLLYLAARELRSPARLSLGEGRLQE